MAVPTTTAGRTSSASLRRARLSSIRLAVPVTICVSDPTNLPSTCSPASLAQLLAEDVPIANVLAAPRRRSRLRWRPRQQIRHSPALSSCQNSFVREPVIQGAALYTLEGDFGFSASNASTPPTRSAMR